MKKLIAIILTLSILTACETSAPPEQNEVELTTTGVVTTVEVEVTNAEPTDEHTEEPTIEEIQLADGAVLLVEQDGLSSIFSILYKESDEPEFLFNLWLPHIEVSPDKTKFAVTFRVEYTQHLYIFDVIEREIIEPTFDEYSYTTNPTDTNDFVWLDNDILLTVGGDFHHSGSGHGDVYYYKSTDGSNKKIVSHSIRQTGKIHQIGKIEIDGDYLSLTIVIKPNFDAIYETIPITKVYELIESDETFILDPTNIEGAE
jgi:hypothetical protein